PRTSHPGMGRLVQPQAALPRTRPHPTRRIREEPLPSNRVRPSGRDSHDRACMKPGEVHALSSDVTPTSDGCEECLRTGDRWVHLRVCMHCGHVGCCDSSPNRHATAHWKTHPYHPLVRSYEPGEDWWWCYADRIVFYVDGAPPAPSHP